MDLPLEIQIAAFTQILKMSGVPSKFLPAMAVFIGALLGLAEIEFSLKGAIHGALSGLVTTGTVNLVDKRISHMEEMSVK